MADSIVGNTELDATKQALIAARVQKEIQFRAKLAPLFTDVSSFAVKGAKSIGFPKLTSFTAVDRPTATAGDATVLTSSVDTLDLDKKPYVAWIVDQNDEVQSTLNFQLEAAARAASAHGRRFDNDVITEMEAVGIATATAGDISYAICLEMREQYLDNEGEMDMGMAAWVVSGDQETALLNIDEFKRQDTYGPNAAIRAGFIGTLFGAPVIRHNGLADSTYYLAGKEGLVYGFQRQPAMDNESDNRYGVGARRWAMDQLYGVKGCLLGEGSAGATESAHIIKDGNI
jgi:hypothetical protein